MKHSTFLRTYACILLFLCAAISSAQAALPIVSIAPGIHAIEPTRNPDGNVTGGQDGTFTITRNSTVGALTVYYAIGHGLGTGFAEPEDPNLVWYQPGYAYDCTYHNDFDMGDWNSSVIFASGEATKTLIAHPFRDDDCEGNELIRVSLQANAAYTIGTGTADLVLEDGRSAGAYADYIPNVPTSANEGQTVSFRLKRFAAPCDYTGQDLKVALFFSGDSTFGTDYTMALGGADVFAGTDTCGRPYWKVWPVIIPAGSPYLDVTLTFVSDGIKENAEGNWVNTFCQGPGGVSFVINDLGGPQPNPPSPVSTVSGNNTVFVWWKAVVDASYYIVQRAVVQGGNPPPWNQCYGVFYDHAYSTTTYLPDDYAQNGTRYAYRVISVSKAYGAGPPGSYAIGTPSATYSPAVSVAAIDNTASETAGNSGVFRFARSGSTASALTIYYYVTGTAANGVDYLAVPTSITFNAGEGTKDVFIYPYDDNAFEGSETVLVTVNPTGGGYYPAAPSSAGVTILDNEVVTVTATAPDASASESGDTGTFRITRTGPTDAPLTVFLTYSGGATPGSDYSTLPSKVTIPINASTYDLTLTPINDTAVEATETATMTIASGTGYVVGSPASANITILDNDLPTVTVAATIPTVYELSANKGMFTFTRTGPTASALNVNYSVSGSASPNVDYGALSGTISIPAGSSTATLLVATIDDTAIEGNETVIVTVTSISGSYNAGSPATATVTIIDDDLPVVTITASDPNASEAGPDSGQFTVSRTGPTTSSLTVNYSVGGNAISGTDYTALSGSVTIPSSSSSATINVTPIDDSSVEGSESVVLTLTSGSGYTVGAPNNASVTITDNDLPTITISATDANAAEGATPDVGVFTVSRTGPTAMAAVTVNYSVSGTATASSDYSPLTGTVTIPGGTTSTTITVTPVNDSNPENSETVIATLTAGSGYTVGTPNNATVTISDDDPVTVTLSVPDPSASEAGSDTGKFRVTRNGPATSALTVNYSVSGTATSGSDYSALAGSVTIPAAALFADVVVTPINDSNTEGTETVTLSLTSGTGYVVGTPNNGTVSIADDDFAVVTIIATDASASELGINTGTFTVTRSGSTTAPLTVNYGTSGSAVPGVNYTALAGTVTIPAGASSATITVTPIDDGIRTASETVVVTVTGGVGYNVGSPSVATVTIVTPSHSIQAEFPVSSNPSSDGRWRLGWEGTLGGTFNIVTVSSVNYAEDQTPIPYWQPSPGLEPAFFYNSANHSVTFAGGTVVIPAHGVWFGPGLNGYPQKYGVIRYTVQNGEAGTYLLQGRVAAVYTNENFGNSDFHVLLNGIEVFRRDIENAGSSTFIRTLPLRDGDTVDFVIGPGADNDEYGSQLVIDATLTSIASSPLARHDVGDDFSVASNPSVGGRWSYGWESSVGDDFELMTAPSDWNYSQEGVQIFSWQYVEDNSPAVFWNPSGQTISFWNGRTYMPPHIVWFGPGPDGWPQNFSVIRYTVPSGEAGKYAVCAAVDAVYRNISAGDSDFHILVNGVEVATSAIPLGGWSSYYGAFTLAAGDTVDFIVGRGNDGQEYGSQVKLMAEVSKVQSSTPFSVTAPAQDVTVTVGQILLQGTAPLAARTIKVNGITLPVTWTDLTNWSATLGLRIGPNVVQVTAHDGAGNPVGTAQTRIVTFNVVHDLESEFPITSNPSSDGHWRFGWEGTLGGTFNIVTNAGLGYADDGTAIPYWQPSPGMEPAFFYNPTNHAVTFSQTVEIPAHGVWFGPGLDEYPQFYGVIRYTVGMNEAGTYVLEGRVKAVYAAEFGDSDFHILLNGTEILRRDIEIGGASTFSRTVTVSDGDTLDFVIGPGADLSETGSQLIISAKLTSLFPSGLERHDPGEDFSLESNPGIDNRWAFGWENSIGDTFNLVNTLTDWNYSDESIQIFSWQLSSGEAPAFYWNPSAQTASFGSGTVYIPPRTIWFGPGQNNAEQNFSVIRYTVPNGEDGIHVVCMAVDAVYRNIIAGDSDVHVVVNGIEAGAFAIPLGGWGRYSGAFTLLAGDTVDFVIGRGADGSEYGSQVKLQAEVSKAQ